MTEPNFLLFCVNQKATSNTRGATSPHNQYLSFSLTLSGEQSRGISTSQSQHASIWFDWLLTSLHGFVLMILHIYTNWLENNCLFVCFFYSGTKIWTNLGSMYAFPASRETGNVLLMHYTCVHYQHLCLHWLFYTDPYTHIHMYRHTGWWMQEKKLNELWIGVSKYQRWILESI